MDRQSLKWAFAALLAACAGVRAEGLKPAVPPIVDAAPVAVPQAGSPAGGPAAYGPAELVRVIDGLPTATEQFQRLESQGYVIKVQNCAFARLSPAVFILQVRKLPPGVPVTVRTEYWVWTGYLRRVNELTRKGYRVDTVCYVNFPGWLGDHAVIQYQMP